MGSSSTGILAYGYNCGEDFGFDWDAEKPAWYDEDEGWVNSAEIALRAAVGFTEQWQRGDDGSYFDREREADIKVGVTIERYGCDGYNGHLLAAVCHRVGDYGAEDVDLTLPEGCEQRLMWAREVLGLGVGEIGWILASYYG